MSVFFCIVLGREEPLPAVRERREIKPVEEFLQKIPENYPYTVFMRNY
jgi:hypothetical protein